jgi:hypothetical protein
MKWRDSREDRRRRSLRAGGRPRGLSSWWTGLMTRVPPRDGATWASVGVIRPGGDNLASGRLIPEQ